ncbi:expressed unknown protein [Seminavis robusta]|uniref:Uncharacterized protein n=1 Tax=Seminavis robusta TaxID=568900 RepID=A0A9N8HPQ3_9STRA|nr:expressed unknown protein [Seminavis robusta]|eukprot:Sro1116_g242860.1 n/a (255) ;mRNA; f:14368-15132
MRVFLLQALALLPLALGFTTSPGSAYMKTPSRAASEDGRSRAGGVTFTNPKSTLGTILFLNPFLFGPELIVPAIMILGGTVATILIDKDEDVAVKYIAPPEPAPVEEEPPAPAPVPAPAPAPPVTATTPDPTPLPDSIAYKEEDADVQFDQSVARTGRASTGIGADVAAFAEKEMTAGDSIAELRREVAKTLDDTSKVPTTQLLQRSPPPEVKEESKVDFASTTTTTKKRSLPRKVWRVVKKIVAPWRPWKNIS